MARSVPPRRSIADHTVRALIALAALLAGCSDRPDDSVRVITPVEPGSPAFDEAGTWTSASILPDPLGGSAAVLFNGHIYVIGGYFGEGAGPATRLVLRFDPETMVAERLADFPMPVAEAAAVVYRDTLLLIGGNETDELVINARMLVWWYDPSADAWDVWAHMPDRRFRHTAHAYGDQVLVIGGENVTTPPDDSIVVLTDHTMRYAPPPNRSFANPLIGGVIDDMVVVLGSLTNPWLMRYVPDAEGWVDAVASPVSGMATGGVVNGRLHAFIVRPRPMHHIWTPSRDRWVTAPSPPRPVERAATVAFAGRLFLIGGWDEQRRAVTRVQIYTPPN
jgi:hypothetical protein